MPKRIVVIGTGTGVGKTHVSVALLLELSRRGMACSGLKPIETGVDEGQTDAGRLGGASSVAPLAQPYTFPEPVSPHLAARRAGVSIGLDVLAAWVDRHTSAWLVIETAGGLLSPLGPRTTNLDLVRALAPDTLFLVARDQLGVLHDVTACALALNTLAPECPRAVGLLQEPREPDASTGTNASELVGLGVLDQAVSFPRATPDDAATRKAAAQALDLVAGGRFT